MQLTLLGTGNSAGMPLYGCVCTYCLNAHNNYSLRRGPCSALLEVEGKRYLLDAGHMNIHERFPAGTLDGILITHFHPDHVQGLFHLRWGVNQRIAVYCPQDKEGCADLYKHPGILDFRPQAAFQNFSIENVRVTTLPLIHSKLTFGYLFEYQQQRIAYLTDTKGLPEKTQSVLSSQPLDMMVIDCSFIPGSQMKGHNNLDEVFIIIQAIQPKMTVLTHIGHDLDIWFKENEHQLPANIYVGRDNTVVFPKTR